MERMEDIELQTAASKAATTRFKSSASQYQMVFLHLAINAFAAGFYMGARHVEKYGLRYRPYPIWMFWKRSEGLDWFSQDAAKQYIREKVPSLSDEDTRAVESFVATAFRQGALWRVEREKNEDHQYERPPVKPAEAGVPSLRSVE